MRSFEIARKRVDGEVVVENGEEVLAYSDAQLPEYQTRFAAGADFFAAEDVTVPSLWKQIFSSLGSKTEVAMNKALDSIASSLGYSKEEKKEVEVVDIKPTMVHTGVKACMEEDEVLELYNRSSNPKKTGLILANSVGVIDKDYYNNKDNDGEIMFAFYNFKLTDTKIKKGDRIGQGVFKKFLLPEQGLRVKDVERESGFGSTDNK